MGPHRGGALVIGQAPALLAQTLGFEAGKRPVVRDVYRLRGHGSLPGEGRGRWGGGGEETPGDDARRPVEADGS